MRRLPANVELMVLRVLLGTAIAVSFVHYLDDTLRYTDYTGPNPPAVTAWIAAWMLPVAWVLFTAAGLLGYRRFRQRQWTQAAICLGVYSISGLISLGHYLGISIEDLSVFQNTFVFADIALGAALLAFAVWTAVHPMGVRFGGTTRGGSRLAR